VIPNVPLAWFKAGGFVISAAPAAGDAVTLLAYDMDPSAYRSSGNQSDPIDASRHSGAYWIALPFDITDVGAPGDPGSNLVLGQPAGIQIQINGTNIVLGLGAGDFVALASKVNDAIKAWAVWAASGTGTGYIPPTTLTQPGTPPGTVDVGSTLVKCT